MLISLDDRSKQILRAVIQSYIMKPDPVGSRFVTKKYSIGFSPATIRNVMADLEDLGFLRQPHTSAGRVPTDKGYRFFVDDLLHPESIREPAGVNEQFVEEFMRRLWDTRSDLAVMFSEVSEALSALSNYVGLASPPRAEKNTFSRIDLIKHKTDRIIAMLVTEEGVVKNKVFDADPNLTQEDLNRIAKYLNSEYGGRAFDEIRADLAERVLHEKALWDDLVARAIGICEKALCFVEGDIFVSGIYDVVGLPDFSDISRIKDLTRAIKDKHMILRFLEDLAKAEGVHVMIGDESPVQEFKRLSIVVSPYREGDRMMGFVALIGPTRMDYEKAIATVDTVARCIGRTLERR